MKKPLLVLIVFMLFTTTLLAMPVIIQMPGEISNPLQLVATFNVAIVYFATKVVKKLKTKIPPKYILMLVVPVLAVLGALLLNWISPDTNYFITLLIGLGSTFVHEVSRQLQEGDRIYVTQKEKDKILSKA